MSEERRGSDPLLPLVAVRARRLLSSSVFPPLLLNLCILVTALSLGAAPRLSFGFEALKPDSTPTRDVALAGSASDPGATSTSSTAPAPVTSEESAAAAVASAGFPDLTVVIDGDILTVSGVVPDLASRQVVLARLSELDDEVVVVDGLIVEAALDQARAAIVISDNAALISGTVANRAVVTDLVAELVSFYPAQQIDTSGLQVDAGVGELVFVSVTGDLVDGHLRRAIEDGFASVDGVRFDVQLGATPQPRIERELEAALRPTPIAFELESAELSNGSAPVLVEVARILSQFPNAAVEVGGHTDDTGDEQQNLTLSQERAEVVASALVELGVENELLIVGYGQLRPIGNDAANRRIEFRLR